MNTGLFSAQVNEIERVLKSLDLFQERNYFPDYNKSTAARFRNKSYRRIWEICFSEQLYDFVFSDFSLLQFRANFASSTFHYAYYESPYLVLTYYDYLVQECGFSTDEIDEIGDELKSDYDVALATSGLREMATPVRYDYEPDLYVEGRHPASHIHIGHNNSIRIGTRRLLRPISFLLLVIRQCYPNKWHTLLNADTDRVLCRNVRNNLPEIAPEFWNPLDEWEMVFE